MSYWVKDYLAALQLRDSKEKASKEVYDAYTRLAAKAASIGKDPADGPSASEKNENMNALGTDTAITIATTSIIRQELIEAQRGRMELQANLNTITGEIEKLRLRSRLESRHTSELNNEKAVLTTKLRDREEELRGKAKLLEDVHDETVSLTLQLNMAEAQNKKLRAENTELVDRWMARMGQEADAMNTASKFS